MNDDTSPVNPTPRLVGLVAFKPAVGWWAVMKSRSVEENTWRDPVAGWGIFNTGGVGSTIVAMCVVDDQLRPVAERPRFEYLFRSGERYCTCENPKLMEYGDSWCMRCQGEVQP